MALAKCTKCDNIYYWPMRKKDKLANHPCPKCGGKGKAYSGWK